MDISAVFMIALAGVAAFAALSSRLARSPITLPIVFALIGWGLSFGNFSGLEMGAGRNTLKLFAEITLILLLFADASQVPLKQLRGTYRIPLRMLLIGLPLTIALGTLGASFASPDAPWAVWLLVAAVLTPTDIALGQALIANEQISVKLRDAIKVESGLNDGLVLPVVTFAALAAAATMGPAATGDRTDGVVLDALWQLLVGPLVGIGVGLLAAALLDFADRRGWTQAAMQSLYFLATAYLCFLLAEEAGANGLLAAFAGGLAFGHSLQCSSRFVAEFMDSEGQLLTMATFLIFGIAMVPVALDHASWGTLGLALAILTIVRMGPVLLSLLGTDLAWTDRLFLAWFGPRGLASILFALLVLEEYPIPGGEEVLACVVLTVLLSIFAHGLSAWPLSQWMARKS